MKSTAIGLGLVLALAGAALADGEPSYDPKHITLPATPWSGAYLGVGVGYGHSTSENDYYEDDNGDIFTSTFDGEAMHGGLVKFYAGIDRQLHSRFVIGAFADVDWTDIRLTYNETDSDLPGFDINDELEIEWQWAVGARAGYLFTPQTLLYFTGGFTQAHFKSDGWYDIYSFPDVFPGKSSVTYNGYFVGFGMETLIGHGLALRGEMRYSEFDGQVVNAGDDGFGTTWVDKEDPTLLAGWIGLSYKFGHREEMAPIK